MPPRPRYTVKLPMALDALVQARVRTGTPFAVLIRDALSAYLADTAPTEAPTSADSADTLRDVQAQLAALTQRVTALEHASTPHRQSADRAADRPADTAPTRLPGGQFKLTPRQVASLRAKRARGTPIKALMEEFDISKATLFRYLK
jgi:response regulator of citrate/malate metabolism